MDKGLAPGEVIHRGRFKFLTPRQKTWLKRRQTIEPLIGYTKTDLRMDRCWLKGPEGDALHAALCAAGFSIRWLLRAIARVGLPGPLLAHFGLAIYAGIAPRSLVPQHTAPLPR